MLECLSISSREKKWPVSYCCSLDPQFDLDSIWTFIFGVPASSGTVVSSIHNVCTESAFLLLGMLRSMLNSVSSRRPEGWQPTDRMQCWLPHRKSSLPFTITVCFPWLWSSPCFLTSNVRTDSVCSWDHRLQAGGVAHWMTLCLPSERRGLCSSS